MAKTAKKLKMLAATTTSECTAAKRTTKLRVGWEAPTTAGKSMDEAAFTSMANRPARKRRATVLARKIRDVGMGSGTKLAKSRRSGKMLSHHQRATPPVTTMESTMKKYSSGNAAVRGSKLVWPRSHRSNDPYLSNKNIEIKPPGTASSVSTRPKLRLSSSSSPLLPCKIRFMNSCTSKGKGVRA